VEPSRRRAEGLVESPVWIGVGEVSARLPRPIGALKRFGIIIPAPYGSAGLAVVVLSVAPSIVAVSVLSVAPSIVAVSVGPFAVWISWDAHVVLDVDVTPGE
jgi:hypothetical protein